jgi:Ohr subfamily peroxiredoxin
MTILYKAVALALEDLMDTIKPLFTAAATATGGRNGHTEASDGLMSANLSVPKGMGGPGKPGTTTPEHLFAGGYAACFGGALDFVGKQHKKDASKARITADVIDRTARGRRLRARGEAARRRFDFAASRARRARQGGTRENLPVFARDARQCRCADRREGGVRGRSNSLCGNFLIFCLVRTAGLEPAWEVTPEGF